MNKKISIVMAYYNRKTQLLFTLKTIERSSHKNIEIIIVDDNSDKEHQLDNDEITKYSFPIKYIKFTRTNEKSINPCVVYNRGFKEVSGDIVIIQNPECCHIGDVIKYINDNLKINEFYSFSCANLYYPELNNEFYKSYNEGNELKFIETLPHIWCKWLNHPIHRPVGFHFLSAINKSDLDNLKGFDERYEFGSCFDDNEFVERVKYNLIFKIIEPNNPFTVHQCHNKKILPNEKELYYINRLVYDAHMQELRSKK